MRINRVDFKKEQKLGAQEARYNYIASVSTAESSDLPIPEKPGAEIHLLGDWVLVIEVWKDKKHPRASFVVPREGVDRIVPTEEQAAQMLTVLAE